MTNKRKLPKTVFFFAVLTIACVMTGCQYRQRSGVYEAYEAFFSEETYRNDLSYPESVRCQAAYINPDDIPELLMATGDGHADRVFIYAYSQNDSAVRLLGAYSSFGALSYIDRGGVISAMYGGTGFWYNTYIQFEEGWTEQILAISGIAATREPVTQYWLSPYSGNGNLAYFPDELCKEENEVTDDVFLAKYQDFSARYGNAWVDISFSQMTAVDLCKKAVLSTIQ